MNFLGIGYGEVLIIIVAALIIFGPDKLPEVAGQAARWIRDARKMMTEMSGEFERNAGVREFKDAIEGEIRGVRKELEDAGVSVKKDLNAAAGTVTSTVKSATSTKPTGSAKSTATAGANKAASTTPAAKTTARARASKADPYAGLVQLTEVAPKQRKAAIVAAAEPATNGHANGSSEPIRETSEAVMRARERRLAAGYNRRIPAS
ncbi:MAG TPA: twin-arginine translocase TatA/TatE family subunit [Thermomicrobiales bacterium]|jgi:Tat protein translocase TatB subunit|nr:twin-arginine translocase TatA/TatE family subunit [Thermomicrobiales bacterium]